MSFFDQQIVLENHRVRLVPFAAEYELELRKIIFDDELGYAVHCTSDDDLKEYIENTIARRRIQREYPFIVIDKETNEVAGSTRYGSIVFENKRLEIGWTWYGMKFRGSGLNKACKFVLLKYAFEEMGFRRVQFSADVDNIRSQKAIVKLGAKQEGIFRSNYINTDGQSRDDIYFSILHTEWHNLKQTVFKEPGGGVNMITISSIQSENLHDLGRLYEQLVHHKTNCNNQIKVFQSIKDNDNYALLGAFNEEKAVGYRKTFH